MTHGFPLLTARKKERWEERYHEGKTATGRGGDFFGACHVKSIGKTGEGIQQTRKGRQTSRKKGTVRGSRGADGKAVKVQTTNLSRTIRGRGQKKKQGFKGLLRGGGVDDQGEEKNRDKKKKKDDERWTEIHSRSR